MRPLKVPELVVQRASTNADGQRWLEALPRVVDALSDRWELAIGEPYTSGTAGYVVAATDAAGRACVLKVAMPLDMDEHDAFLRSVRAHELAAGRGCAELLDHDISVPALLLERLGPNLADLQLGVPDVLRVIASTLREFWRDVGSGSGLQRGDEKARWLADYISATWEEVGRPGEREVIEVALDLCERRIQVFDPKSAVLVHGDAHGWNTLSAGAGVYKFVDVEGLWSERAHDLAVPMREYNEPLLRGDTRRLVLERARSLAHQCDVDARAVWEWGFIERVSTGLANVREFGEQAGAPFLEVARRCCEDRPYRRAD